MKLAAVLLFVSAIAARPALAQLGLGAEAGFNASKYRVNSLFNTKSKSTKQGVRCGLFADVAFTDNTGLQAGVYYVAKGAKQSRYNYNSFAINAIDIPVNVTYKFGELGNHRLFIFGGPFVSINISGTYQQYTSPTSTIARAIQFGRDYSNGLTRLEGGICGGLGYQLATGLFFRVRGQATQPVGNSSGLNRGVGHNVGFSITAGYVLYRKDKDGALIINRNRHGAEKVKTTREWRDEHL